MNGRHAGMTVTCPASEGVYLLLEDLGSRGWRCLVISADVNYSDMETVGSTVVISREWVHETAVPVVS